MSGTEWVQIAADTKLNEILERYSSVGPILVQAGRGWVNKPGDTASLSVSTPDLAGYKKTVYRFDYRPDGKAAASSSHPRRLTP